MSGTGIEASATRSLLGVWALFLALAFLQIGRGLERVLLPIRAGSEGFGAGWMGAVMASHFAGFLLGAKVTSRFLVSVGHIRVFAAFASVASVAVLLNATLVSPISWSAVYFVSGACTAGIVIIVESWLNDRATNETRGRILGAYSMILMGGMAGGQLLANIGSAEGFRLFILASVLVSLAVVPVTLSASTSAPTPSNESMPLPELYRIIPAAVVGILLTSFVQSAASSMAAVFASESEMPSGRVTMFTASALIGAVTLQMPLGELSDRFPRRAVILGVAGASCGLASLGALLPASSLWLIAVNLAFGAFVFPLYGQFIALANDWVPQHQRVAAASALVLASSCGAITAPVVIGFLITVFGPTSYFLTNAAVLGILVSYLSYRTRVREAVPLEKQTLFQPVIARSGPIAHAVGDWMRHPLAGWNHGRRQGD